ncbi:hypothetical protein [Terrisporobacter hibernicus]|uniref:Uncharacterized protein n=1 Tax=Terrisporobacter hibernicus TaxID=2813371 RepID=A0AAX2ZFN4_9FIRM|nr:hypothetical protein [Terrisporobacter hibernicus]UEL47560.1 hypothetical protein JW646_18365 [Terrisporobacter hibernicus]
MAVDDYTTVDKVEIDELIELTVKGEYFMQCTPIEHYTIEGLKEISEKAKKNNLVMTISEEHSNFYQGVLICLIQRNDVKGCIEYI